MASFNGLSLELRQRVYDYALVDENEPGINVDNRKIQIILNDTLAARFKHNGRVFTSLLLVDHAMNVEIESYVLQHFMFVLEDDKRSFRFVIRAFYRQLGKRRDLIRRMAIPMLTCDWHSIDYTIYPLEQILGPRRDFAIGFEMLRRFSNLTDLQIGIDPIEFHPQRTFMDNGERDWVTSAETNSEHTAVHQLLFLGLSRLSNLPELELGVQFKTFVLDPMARYLESRDDYSRPFFEGIGPRRRADEAWESHGDVILQYLQKDIRPKNIAIIKI